MSSPVAPGAPAAAGPPLPGVTRQCDFGLVIGQSLAVLWPPSAQARVLAPGRGIYFDAGRWQDLTQNGVSAGGFFAAFAETWFAATGRTFAFVPTAVSGSGLLPNVGDNGQNWSLNGNLLPAALSKCAAALQALAGTTVLTHSCIMDQGQHDANQINAGNPAVTQAAYLAALIALRRRVRDDTGRAAFFISRCGTDPSVSDVGYAAIRAAHDAVTYPADENTFIVFDEALYWTVYGVQDQTSPVHPVQAGYNLMGATMATRMRRVLAAIDF
jgi:hypothetical protein